MRIATLIAAAGLLAGCAVQPGAGRPPELKRAEALVDAFYSFDPARLRAVMADAPDSLPRLLYYQGWAQGGNYVVLKREPCRLDKPDEVSCAITVRDDLAPALRIPFDVTDIFHLSFREGRIVSVRNSSNDPPEFEQALKWVAAKHPKLLDEQCRGFFAGGPTPQACVREVVKGFREFSARPK